MALILPLLGIGALVLVGIVVLNGVAVAKSPGRRGPMAMLVFGGLFAFIGLVLYIAGRATAPGLEDVFRDSYQSDLDLSNALSLGGMGVGGVAVILMVIGAILWNGQKSQAIAPQHHGVMYPPSAATCGGCGTHLAPEAMFCSVCGTHR